MEQGSSSERYTRNYNSEHITVHQLQYFKEHTLDETKLLIFKILRNLPTDVHLPILIILDQYEEWQIIEAITAEYNYEYSSFLIQSKSKQSLGFASLISNSDCLSGSGIIPYLCLYGCFLLS